MRFFITSNIKNNPALRILILAILTGCLLYWIGNWFFYHSKFGLSYNKMFLYFFSDPSFPEPLPISQLFEDIHISMFMVIVLCTLLSSLFLQSQKNKFQQTVLILTLFGTGITEVLLSLVIYFISPVFIYAKIFAFLFFQITFLLMFIITLRFYLLGKGETYTEKSLLYTVVLLFSTSAVLFTFLSFFLFISKVGVTPQSISEYYLGNPTKFMKPKSLSTLLESTVPHLLVMSVFIFTLIHFILFTTFKGKLLSGILLFSCAFLESTSGLFIRLGVEPFSYIKLISFIGFCAGVLFLSFKVIISVGSSIKS